MLVHDFALVSVPCPDVTDCLRTEGAQMLRSCVAGAMEDAFGEVSCQIDVGQVLDSSQAFVLPFEVRPEPDGASFQRMQGDLEYFAIDPQRCQLRLLASYTPAGHANPSLLEHARVERAMRAALTDLTQQVEAAHRAYRPGHG